jgi:ABC-type molybdate transport system substrate-binding protein
MRRAALAAVLSVGLVTQAAAQEPVRLYAAGSLRAALEEIGAQFTAETGTRVAGTYGASGLLRQRIDKGEKAEVFASANMEHPAALARCSRNRCSKACSTPRSSSAPRRRRPIRRAIMRG